MTVYRRGPQLRSASIGVLCLDTRFPKPPGHIRNPSGLDFSVTYETVRGATVKELVFDPSSKYIAPFIDAAKRLEAKGVRAITGSCGFLALFQKELAAAVKIPVFASSLIQVPLVYHLTGAAAPVGVLTASGDNLTPAHFAAVGAADIPVVIQGMEGRSEFNDVIIEAKRTTMDVGKIEAEVLAAASAMIDAHPEIRGLVLECTDMPPYAYQLHARFGLPVFDLTTLATMVHDAVSRTPYTGSMPGD